RCGRPPAGCCCVLWGSVVCLACPQIRGEPVFFGLNGSDTSYCKNSPGPKHEKERNLSSRDKLMSVTSGGTALKSLSNGGSFSGSAGSAGISITFFTSHSPLS